MQLLSPMPSHTFRSCSSFLFLSSFPFEFPGSSVCEGLLLSFCLSLSFPLPLLPWASREKETMAETINKNNFFIKMILIFHERPVAFEIETGLITYFAGTDHPPHTVHE